MIRCTIMMGNPVLEMACAEGDAEFEVVMF